MKKKRIKAQGKTPHLNPPIDALKGDEEQKEKKDEGVEEAGGGGGEEE